MENYSFFQTLGRVHHSESKAEEGNNDPRAEKEEKVVKEAINTGNLRKS